MSVVTTIQATDLLSSSRSIINTNFSNLNADKVEGAQQLSTVNRMVAVGATGSVKEAAHLSIGASDNSFRVFSSWSGVTWPSDWAVLSIGEKASIVSVGDLATATSLIIVANAYYASSAWRYREGSFWASMLSLRMADGSMSFQVASPGTTGSALSFSAILDVSNSGISITRRVTISGIGTSGDQLRIVRNQSGEHAYISFRDQNSVLRWSVSYNDDDRFVIGRYNSVGGYVDSPLIVEAGGTILLGNVTRLHSRASAPSSPANGDMYYDTTLNVVRFYRNGSWANV